MPNAPFEHYVEPLLVQIGGNYSYLHVAIVSPPEPTKSIFLFHDLAGRSDDFAVLAPHLARLGYRVVMIDLPGRGKSAWLEEADYTLRMYVDVFLSLINAHGLPVNVALGQGWGAMMTVLFENVVAQPFQQTFLFDLPLEWSYATDPTAQLWAELALLRSDTHADFVTKAASAIPYDLPGRVDFLAMVAERARHVDNAFSISIDAAIFGNLRRSGDKLYKLNTALAKARSPIWLLQGSKSAMPLSTQLPLGQSDHSNMIRQTQILRGSNISWGNDALILPALGAIQIGAHSKTIE